MQKISVTAKDGAAIPVVVSGIDSAGKKGIVIISHGFGEHSGSYAELAEVLLQAGYASLIPDQRGHGIPPVGVSKWHGIIPSYQSFLEDIITLVDFTRRMAPDTPIVLYGHSMGGNIAVNTLLRYDLGFTCAVLESPWLGLFDPLDPVKVALIKLLGRLSPSITIERKLRKSDLTTDEVKAEGYVRDPYYHNIVSMRMLSGVLNGCVFALKNANQLNLPTFIGIAKNDRVVCNKAINSFIINAGDMSTAKEYESNHAIHNDVHHETYYSDVIAFLDSHC